MMVTLARVVLFRLAYVYFTVTAVVGLFLCSAGGLHFGVVTLLVEAPAKFGRVGVRAFETSSWAPPSMSPGSWLWG
jgi:hypothetical protein